MRIILTNIFILNNLIMGEFLFYPQLSKNCCGVACLKMIATFYGKNFDDLKINDLAKDDGLSLFQLAEIARKIGFNAIAATTESGSFLNERLPVILHWNQNHYVVLYDIINYRYYIADPANGMLKYDKHQFEYYWLKGLNSKEGVILNVIN